MKKYWWIGLIIGGIFLFTAPLLAKSLPPKKEEKKEKPKLLLKEVSEVLKKWGDIINEMSEKYGVPRVLIAAVIYHESGGKETAFRYEPVYNLRYIVPASLKEPLFPGVTVADIIKGRFILIDRKKNGYRFKCVRKMYDKEYKTFLELTKDKDLKKIPANITRSSSLGLMQLMYDTACKVAGRELNPVELFNPRLNIELGTKHLAYLYDKFKDWNLAIRAYNAGEKAVEKSKEAGKEYAEVVFKYAGMA
ncbi:MAG: lytic transglycosylase domain-containing protein [Nitrososphaerota archaeon]